MTRAIAELDASLIEDGLFRLSWPIARLGEAVEALARRANLAREPAPMPLQLPATADDVDEIERWLDWATAQLGIEAVEVDAPAAALEPMLLGGGPAILLQRTGFGIGFLALAGRRGDRPLFLSPDLDIVAVPLEPVRAFLCRWLEAPLRPEIERLMDLAEVPAARRRTVAAAMLRDRLAEKRVGGVFMLRLPASAPITAQLRQAKAGRLLATVLGIFCFAYALEIAGWGLIGSGALGGRLDFGWLAAWALMLSTLLGARVAGSWVSARFALAVGRTLKARLLAGALALRPDAVKRGGVGQMIGRVIESQALESLSLNGGLAVIVAAIELVFSAWVLGEGAAPTFHIALLLVFTAAALAMGWRFHRRLATWSRSRLDLTNDLIEAMVGHRTRLAQERPARRDAREDGAIQSYLDISSAMDRTALTGVSSLPSLWMFAGIAALLPAFADAAGAGEMAISLGGLLLAQRAFAGISGGLSGLARALVAWQQVKPIFGAARAARVPGPFLPAPSPDNRKRRLIDAEELVFHYPGASARVIDRASLAIERGERVLLQGPSGGGKSTLAALLTGLELPESGLLLLDGLDRPSLGGAWHRLATSAPQFHENYILSGTLAFNLLMGRRWPARDEDMAEAKALCEALGLGDLLKRMPGGLNQRVGETGWQLSHGERSRIFLARALLQDAELTVMDESFAALDPETLDLCLRCAMERARTMVVIAHP